MKRILWLLIVTLFATAAHAEVWQARYGVAETFNFKLYNADGTLDTDEADGGTEVSLSCNEGNETTATNDFVDEGTYYSIALTTAEMQCERIAVVIAATTTEVFFIQTSGNSSAMTPTFEANVATVTADAITASAIAANAITSSEVADGAIDAGALASDTITAAKVAADVSTEFSAATFTVNATQISGDSGAADALELAFDGTATGARLLGFDRVGTAQSATSTTIVLDSGAAYGDNAVASWLVIACGSVQGYCQSSPVASNVGSTDTLTLTKPFVVTPSGTITFYLVPTAIDDLLTVLGLDSGNLGELLEPIDDIQAGVTGVSDDLTLVRIKTDEITFSVDGQVDVNVKSQTDLEVCGTGTENDPWGACP